MKLWNNQENRIWSFMTKHVIPDMEEYGYVLPINPNLSMKDRLRVCMLKGILIFAVTQGCIGGLISSFSLNVHMATIFVILLVLSMITAMLRVQILYFDIGYPILFFIFVVGISSSYRMVNQGYQTFVSIMQSKYSDYYGLNMVRETEESAYDPATAMTYAAVYIGFFLILLLNMIISEHMSLWLTIILTFPIFQLGIYIGNYPSFIYLYMLLFGYFFIGLWRFSGHFQIPMKKKEQTQYAFKREYKKLRYNYRVDGMAVSKLAGMVAILALIVSIMLFTTQNTKSLEKKADSDLRASIDQKLQIITQTGLYGLFDRYQATGGLSEGKLGGVSSVHPDYEPDLSVTFVPYSTKDIYLKGYTGTYYTGSSWEPYYPEVSPSDLSHYYNSVYAAKSIIENHGGGGSSQQRMSIENLDANERYLYVPYYVSNLLNVNASENNGVLLGEHMIGTKKDFLFYPKDLLSRVLGDNFRCGDGYEYTGNTMYQTYFDSVYLDVPENLLQDLEQIKDEIGYGRTTTEQIRLIQQFFATEFVYSMSPGTTPYNQDFVVYFLKNQRRGYCAHYASAATLLLRSYGIPARYVEGYCFSPIEAVGNVNDEEKVSDWVYGESAFEDASVVTMEITDGDAHAWVEIYFENAGWVPYEFTLGAVEADNNVLGGSFFSVFGNLLSGGDFGSENGNNGGEATLDRNMSIREISGTVLLYVFMVFIGLIVAVFLYFGVKKLLYVIRLRLAYRRGDYEPYLLYSYQKRRDKMQSAKMHKQYGDVIYTIPVVKEDIYELLEKCCFSKDGIQKQEANTILRALREKT